MSEQDAEQASHSYFVPMIDMLAGVVFILVIMLAAVSLVQRDDFKQAGAMQAEISKIAAELAKARQMEVTYIEPRRIAREALELLLKHLHDQLAAAGITSQPLPDEGRLLITAPEIFAANGTSLSDGGKAAATTLAGAMIAELPCLTRQAPATPACAAYQGAHLDAASIVVAGAAPGINPDEAEARALSLLSAAAAARPALLAQRAVDGRKLLDYRAAQPAAIPAGAQPAAIPAGTPQAAGDGLELDFVMNVPPLPKP